MGLFDYPVGGDAAGIPPAFTFLETAESDALKKLLPYVETIHFDTGQTVIETGSEDNAFYILLSGEVEVVVRRRGKDAALATIPQGSVFGEIAFFDGKPRSAIIRARKPGAAIRVTRESFDLFSAWEPVLSRLILFDLGKVLALRLRWTTGFVRG